jgi:hypothetical protein
MMGITWSTRIAGFALATAAVLTPAMKAQTVISNESLVSTTFVVNKTNIMAGCAGDPGCVAPPMPLFKPIHVTCPAATGKTCTLGISLDAKTQVSIQDGNSGEEGIYQFLMDGAPPVPGPTDEQGFYIFTIYAAAFDNYPQQTRLSYPASLVGAVKNSGSSKDHVVKVSVSCVDVLKQGGCEVDAHWSTMRIDVFEP